MARPTDAHVQTAERLLAHGDARDAEDRARSAGRVYDALFASLAPVIGAAAVRALLARSVRLTMGEFPGLCDASASRPPEDDLPIAQELVACLSKLEPVEAYAAATALYAAFFGLLTSFIGEEVTWTIVKRAFPGITLQAERRTSRRRKNAATE
jgi:hypothetical protein